MKQDPQTIAAKILKWFFKIEAKENIDAKEYLKTTLHRYFELLNKKNRYEVTALLIQSAEVSNDELTDILSILYQIKGTKA